MFDALRSDDRFGLRKFACLDICNFQTFASVKRHTQALISKHVLFNVNFRESRVHLIVKVSDNFYTFQDSFLFFGEVVDERAI